MKNIKDICDIPYEKNDVEKVLDEIERLLLNEEGDIWNILDRHIMSPNSYIKNIGRLHEVQSLLETYRCEIKPKYYYKEKK